MMLFPYHLWYSSPVRSFVINQDFTLRFSDGLVLVTSAKHGIVSLALHQSENFSDFNILNSSVWSVALFYHGAMPIHSTIISGTFASHHATSLPLPSL